MKPTPKPASRPRRSQRLRNVRAACSRGARRRGASRPGSHQPSPSTDFAGHSVSGREVAAILSRSPPRHAAPDFARLRLHPSPGTISLPHVPGGPMSSCRSLPRRPRAPRRSRPRRRRGSQRGCASPCASRRSLEKGPLDGRLLLLLSTDPSAEPRFQISDTSVAEEPAGVRHRRRRLEARARRRSSTRASSATRRRASAT